MRRVVRVYLPQNKNKVNTLLVKLDCCIFTFIITACIPDRPWYARHEKAEIKFLKRHKRFLSEINTYCDSNRPIWSWLQNSAFEDFESERDAKLCMSRTGKLFGTSGKYDGCRNTINSMERICLECIDMYLCTNCYKRKIEPSGHANFHKMAELR